eukprot:TRINITY_DN748_c0_g1_i1.p3 TRINITY_DN748_c0_g1~~TRINITY_DN748_c0_g1_i1.p3  ORF type:complete len:68 (+),score=13.87 TRINITY_DN748_c0_g1_i1:413-616(+)
MWYHPGCVGMTNETYENLSKSEKTWICSVCIESAKEPDEFVRDEPGGTTQLKFSSNDSGYLADSIVG